MINNSVLAIEEVGTYLTKSGNRLIVNNKGKKSEYSADTIRQVLFTAPASISTEAVKLAIEKHIDIVYLDWKGKPFARTYSPYMGGTTLTRRKQLEAYLSKKGKHLIVKFVEGKIRSQINYLKSLSKDRKTNTQLNQLSKTKFPKSKLITSNPIDKLRSTLLGVEGATAAKYFRGLGLITGFTKRNKNGEDMFNVCLNYAYGMLYSEVERACIIAGLDPYLGFYHTDRYGKPSLVLDVTELFRVAISDRAIVTLFNRKQINGKDFDKTGDLTLSQKGKRKLIQAVINRLNTKLTYKGKKLILRDIILAQTREISAYLLGNKRDFSPYIYK
ncbi:CRISPR-associated endonuclease Cas1 [Candidatus Daviesbacteria bacterium]|nr:CRISPR-associated endonuclease Cas1 [Candidatus Daviesbacteria bacterium]